LTDLYLSRTEGSQANCFSLSKKLKTQTYVQEIVRIGDWIQNWQLIWSRSYKTSRKHVLRTARQTVTAYNLP